MYGSVWIHQEILYFFVVCVNNRLCALILATGWEIDPHKLKFGGEIVDTIPVDRNIVGGVCMISFYLWSLDVYSSLLIIIYTTAYMVRLYITTICCINTIYTPWAL